jgi:hypothetical protein
MPGPAGCCQHPASAYLGRVDWQQLTALAIVAATAGIFVWQRFRRRRFGGHAGCGCAASQDKTSAPSIVVTSRRGERQQIIFKAR